MQDVIKSAENRLIKQIRKVHDRKKGDDLVYIEGLRIVEDCLLSGGECERLICSESKYTLAAELADKYNNMIGGAIWDSDFAAGG